MTDEAKALVEKLREVAKVLYYELLRPTESETVGQAFHLIETQAREIERLRADKERMGRDKETLLTFARAIQTWISDADSYDEECDHPQRDYCEDVELMEKAAGYALRRIAERTTLAGDSHDQ